MSEWGRVRVEKQVVKCNDPHGGCWQDHDGSCQQPVNINAWHLKTAVCTE